MSTSLSRYAPQPGSPDVPADSRTGVLVGGLVGVLNSAQPPLDLRLCWLQPPGPVEDWASRARWSAGELRRILRDRSQYLVFVYPYLPVLAYDSDPAMLTRVRRGLQALQAKVRVSRQRIVVFVDETAPLLAVPEVEKPFVQLARTGRKYGVGLVCAGTDFKATTIPTTVSTRPTIIIAKMGRMSGWANRPARNDRPNECHTVSATVSSCRGAKKRRPSPMKASAIYTARRFIAPPTSPPTNPVEATSTWTEGLRALCAIATSAGRGGGAIRC